MADALTEERLQEIEVRANAWISSPNPDRGMVNASAADVPQLLHALREARGKLQRERRCPACGEYRECVGCGHNW